MPNIRFRLNGVPTEIDADPDTPLLTILRGRLGMTGSHFGCGAGECGACNVMVGNHDITSCDAPLWSVADKDVTTIEGQRAKPASASTRLHRRAGAAMRILSLRHHDERGCTAETESESECF